MDDYMTVEQAAAVLGIKPVTVRARLKKGTMRGVQPAQRLWLIPRHEVERWKSIGKIQGHRRPPVGT